MLNRIRQAVGARPRVILTILLAFGIEVLPLASGLVSHRHAGGGVGHAHAGRIVGVAPRVIGADAPLDARNGIERAPARDLHQHVVQPLIALRDAAPLPPGPSLFTTNLPIPAVPSEIPAARRAGQARSPPLVAA